MVLATMRIPAATLNAVVQRLIPPPKYDIDRLIPTARVAPEAQIAGLVIIQRDGDFELELDHRRGARDPDRELRGRVRVSRPTPRSRGSCRA